MLVVLSAAGGGGRGIIKFTQGSKPLGAGPDEGENLNCDLEGCVKD